MYMHMSEHCIGTTAQDNRRAGKNKIKVFGEPGAAAPSEAGAIVLFACLPAIVLFALWRVRACVRVCVRA